MHLTWIATTILAVITSNVVAAPKYKFWAPFYFGMTDEYYGRQTKNLASKVGSLCQIGHGDRKTDLCHKIRVGLNKLNKLELSHDPGFKFMKIQVKSDLDKLKELDHEEEEGETEEGEAEEGETEEEENEDSN
ncbi:hypothetical protein G7Y89_g2171 [Cudoniella acicularis]|uniref:Uncharacterized protein n=1 Tax=Cudoniella acicularis TaxID=354080 RepID=A0A8H4RTU8_9HELO|nr:hypothetical protein G7Y89_g2171 [Cudoniella acicularis]